MNRGARAVLYFAVAAVLLLVGGSSVSASSGPWGTFRGYNIVQVQVNGTPLKPDVPAVILDGRTMVPLSFVAQAFGDGVAWNGATYVVSVTTKSYVPSTDAQLLAETSSIMNDSSTVAAQTDILDTYKGWLEGGAPAAVDVQDLEGDYTWLKTQAQLMVGLIPGDSYQSALVLDYTAELLDEITLASDLISAGNASLSADQSAFQDNMALAAVHFSGIQNAQSHITSDLPAVQNGQ